MRHSHVGHVKGATLGKSAGRAEGAEQNAKCKTQSTNLSELYYMERKWFHVHLYD
jgi:hypothetical protein